MVENKNGSDIKNFLTGLIIGGALGMLFAPHEGSKARKMIKEKVGSTASTLGENIKKSADQVKSDLADKAEDLKEKLERDVQPEVEEAVENVSRKVK